MERLLRVLLLTSLSLGGCTDYTVAKIIDYAPEINVEPLEYNYGHVNANGGLGTAEFTISNRGNDTLLLHDAELSNDLVEDLSFSTNGFSVDSLEPGESTSLEVTFDPRTYENTSADLEIYSNDDDDSVVVVPLHGVGDSPIIDVTPEEYDFGEIYVGCDDALGVLIENQGNVDLEITNVDFFVTVPVDFEIEDYETNEGPLPWIMSPSDYISLRVDYLPLDILDDSAYIEITSNDPLSPIVQSYHEGTGDYAGMLLESFEQEDLSEVDILFVIDNSGSMASNQTNFKNNFGSFISVFAAAGVDYRIAFITTDDPGFVNGTVITASSTDPVAEVEAIIDAIGTRGNSIEKGLWYAYEATSPAGDAEPGGEFLRSDARFVVVYISDEADYSHLSTNGGGSTTLVPSDYSTQLQSLKSSSTAVVAHAVAGDYPSGCDDNGNADFGDGYYDVVNDLGGTFMSICATDWGAQMDTLARESMAATVYRLTGDPIESTIEVEVDGTTATDWSYNDIDNAIVFSTPPALSSIIDVTYAIWGNCGEDTGF
mgnify:FL=1